MYCTFAVFCVLILLELSLATLIGFAAPQSIAIGSAYTFHTTNLLVQPPLEPIDGISSRLLTPGTVSCRIC